MSKSWGSVLRITLAAAVSVVLLIAISNVIRQPVSAPTQTVQAEFTDVSGLHDGADVRVRGVRVGKVANLELRRVDGRSVAEVTFTIDNRYRVVPTSKLAVKFQALTGLRYIDVIGSADGDGTTSGMSKVPTSMTQPSFDITVLFNGLQPVLATLSPDEINTFTDNVAAFLSGDGEGLGPMLDSIRRLTALVSDRELVIETLVGNLAVLADGVGGQSDQLIELLQIIKGTVGAAMTVLDEFRKSEIYGPDFVAQAVRLLDSVGIRPGIDIDTAMDKAFTNVYDFMDEVKRVPVVWENIGPPPVAGEPAPCHNGRAELPLPMDVLLNGRKVVVCNPR